jgi:single-strand selective monofunctional uracil DNA glycosylase
VRATAGNGVERGLELVRIAGRLAEEVGQLTFSLPVACVYNPLTYAREPFARYAERYGAAPKEAVFLGMNPGPWGMAQTGVPFGDIGLVKGWLGIEGEVGRPPAEHPRKRVEGFSCRRGEVSGQRLWGLFRRKFGDPESFFERFFVLNYCPLLFLDQEGRNLTPDKLKPVELAPLQDACDRALRAAVGFLHAGRVIGVGAYAARQAAAALDGTGIPVGQVLHPSPANPAANRDWEGTVLRQLSQQGVKL